MSSLLINVAVLISTSITFVNGEEQVMSLPQDVQDMFTLLSEDEFRLDISSTELRKKVGI
jgi:hypothetical protein